MSKVTCTEQDRQQALRFFRLFGVAPTDANVRALAVELAFLRDTAVSCAVAQVEREAREREGAS